MINNTFDDLRRLLSNKSFIRYSKLLEWKESANEVLTKIPYFYNSLILDTEVTARLRVLVDWYKNANSNREDYNSSFCKKELENCKGLFDTIEEYPLSEKQREAIVHDEDRNLIIAGAGTGKTTTILGKVGYLIKHRNVDPEKILLLAFTVNAADEMRNRIKSRLAIDLNVMTFHKFGLEIVAQATGEKPRVAFGGEEREMRIFLRDLQNELLKKKDYLADFINFILLHPQPLQAPSESTIIKEPYDDTSIDLRTLKGERVKSQEEKIIADFLFINQISYAYERPYEHKTANKDFSQYLPDFTLTTEKIYIEHYAIDRQGNVPSFFKGMGNKSAKESYNDRIKWHKNIHSYYGTTLIKTYSYEKKEGTLLANLEKKLRAENVAFNPMEPEAVYKQIQKIKGEVLNPYLSLLSTFLNLYKANIKNEEELYAKAQDEESKMRLEAFFKIFVPILNLYNYYLKDNGLVDFSDMIASAKMIIDHGKHRLAFKYIIIDEFQDISWGRYQLILSMLSQGEGKSLFCVGDDWQSIYRFTGSDISLIVDFEKYFGTTKTTFLDTTYRFNDSIAKISGEFIQKNPNQLPKTLITLTQATEPAIEASVYEKNECISELRRILHYISRERVGYRDTSVFILGRYNFNRPKAQDNLKLEFPHLSITWMTVHKSKGMEADYVVIDPLDEGKYGFPTEIIDDPLLYILLEKQQPFENAEERRLLYVAMTRARKKVFLLGNSNSPSKFLIELGATRGLPPLCPICNQGLLVLSREVSNPTSQRFSTQPTDVEGTGWVGRCKRYQCKSVSKVSDEQAANYIKLKSQRKD